ncbi:MAG: OsmC family protein [Pseudomonadota bacterium]
MSKPQPGRYPIAVTARAPTATRTEVQARRHRLTIDEPPSNGGQDLGPLPLEVLLASLAGCSTVIANKIAAEMGIRLEALEIKVSGDLVMAVIQGRGSNPFPEIALSISGRSDASATQQGKLAEELARRCPVSVLLRAAGCRIAETWDLQPLEI